MGQISGLSQARLSMGAIFDHAIAELKSSNKLAFREAAEAGYAAAQSFKEHSVLNTSPAGMAGAIIRCAEGPVDERAKMRF
jgi:hypothetical protein